MSLVGVGHVEWQTTRLLGALCLTAWFVGGCRPAANAPAAPPSTAGAGRSGTLREPGSVPPSNSESHSGPWALVSGGRQIRLRTLEAKVVVIAPLALTELVLTFDAMPPEEQAARLYFELPQAAALHRFAVADAQGWHDAEISTAPLAPPTLAAASSASIRDYAVELSNAGTPPRVRLSYAQPLPLSGYRLPLLGLPTLEALEVSVEAGQKAPKPRVDFQRKDYTPDADFTLGAAELGPVPRVAALRAGKYAVARIVPTGKPSSEITFLVDSSRSQPMPLERLADALEQVSGELGAAPSPPLVSVVAFDQDIHPIVERARPPLDARALAPLRERGRLGGTDVVYAMSTAIAEGLPHRHLVLVSDLAQSITPTGNAFNIRNSELARVDILAVDAAAERRLRDRSGNRLQSEYSGSLLRLAAGPKELARELLAPTPAPMKVEIADAAWVSGGGRSRSPGELAEVGRGLWVFAEYTNDAPLTLSIDGKAEPKLAASRDPALATLLASIVGRAELSQLGATATSEAEARAQLVRFAKERHFIPPGSAFRVTTSSSSGAGLRVKGTGLELSRASDAPASPDAKVLAREIVVYPAPPDEAASSGERHHQKSAGAESCPGLVARSDGYRKEDACPPLAVSFAGATERLFADVSFTRSGSVQGDRSPHLAQLAKVLALRPELEVLGVRTATRAQADGVVRELEKQGVEQARLVVDRPLDASLPARQPTPRCPSAGEQVVFEVQKMGLAALHRNIRQHPSPPVVSRAPNRFESIQALLRYDKNGARGPGALENALFASRRWVAEDRDNPLAYVALGDVLVAAGHQRLAAARAYGSLFDFELPGAGLVLAAAARLELNAGATPDARRHDGTAAQQERVHDVGVQTFHRAWQDHPEQAEGPRAYAYAKYREGDEEHAWGFLYEAAKYSAVAERIELPVFAHLFLKKSRQEGILESLSARDCSFPMQAPVHGVIMSTEDTESELEVSVTSEPKRFEYASVLSDQGGVSRAKWLPLPDDDDAYPIHVTVRATKLGARGYAFGVLRIINYNGRGRLLLDQKAFVATATAPFEVYSERILQVPW